MAMSLTGRENMVLEKGEIKFLSRIRFEVLLEHLEKLGQESESRV